MVHAPGNDPVMILETLAAELRARGFGTTLIAPPGKPPWLTSGTRAPRCSLRPCCTPVAGTGGRGPTGSPRPPTWRTPRPGSPRCSALRAATGERGRRRTRRAGPRLGPSTRSATANLYHAERRDNGARVHEADPGQLRREVEADHRARPVLLPPTWDRVAWEQRVNAAGLPPGGVGIALALARHADDQGVAAPGAVRLASLSGCDLGTVSARLLRLRTAGLIIRTRGGGSAGMARYRLVIPVTPDVGQALPRNAGFS